MHLLRYKEDYVPDQKAKDQKDQSNAPDEQQPEQHEVSADQIQTSSAVPAQEQGTESAASGPELPSLIQVTLDHQAQERLRRLLKAKYH
jgi:hypothetical protein